MSEQKWSNLPTHKDRASQDSPLRQKIYEAAYRFANVLKKDKDPSRDTDLDQDKVGLREIMQGGYGLNRDPDDFIKRFFMEGIGWNEADWEKQKGNDAKEVGAKAEWCAAFASYCVVQGYAAEGRSLPFKTHAAGNHLVNHLKKAGLFIPMASLYDASGAPTNSARLPRRGDFIIYAGGHTGLVDTFEYAQKKFDTIEGNSFTGPRRVDGVYALRGHTLDKANKHCELDKIQGFGIVDPAPCDPATAKCGWLDWDH
jgi:hypothetical protein